MARRVAVSNAQPSQLLVSAAKLRDVLEWFDVDSPESAEAYDPVPCLLPSDVPFDVRGDAILADGHTRAVAAVLSGATELRVERASTTEREAWSMDVYEACVGWCVDAGVTDPRALVGRVVSADTYEREWVDRCRAIE